VVDRAEAAQLITELVYEYLERRLGKLLYFAEIRVDFRDDSTEVEVSVDASPLIDEERLRRIVDEAAEFGVAVSDVIREVGGSVNDLGELRELIRRRLGL